MNSLLLSRVGLSRLAMLLLILFLTPAARADDYVWGGADGNGGDGDFDSPEWFDSEDTNDTKPDHAPPGGGDNAYIPDNSVLTAGGGSVMTLSASPIGGGLEVAGSFSVTNLGSITLTGGGTLTASNIGVIPQDSAETIDVQGANLMAGSVTNGNLTVSDGGSISIGSIGSGVGTFATGSMTQLQVSGTVTNAGIGTADGATARAQGILIDDTHNGATSTSDGAGSLLALGGAVTLHTQGIMATDGGQITVAGDLGLYGNPLIPPASAYADGAGSSITVTGTVDLSAGPGEATGTNVGAIGLTNGALLHASSVHLDGSPISGNDAYYATLTVDTGGKLQVDTSLTVGDLSQGQLQVQGGSGVVLAGSMVVGNQSGGSGQVTISGVSSYLNAAGALISIGDDFGSTGVVELDTSAVMQVTGMGFLESIRVGDGGSGSLTLNSGSTLQVLGTDTDFEIGALGSINVSNGGVSVAGGSTLTTAGPMEVGAEGVGELVVTDAGSTVTVAGEFDVGNASIATGTVTVFQGGQLTANSANNAIGHGGKGTLSVQDAGSSVTLLGQTIVGGSTAGGASDGEFDVSGGATAQMYDADLGFDASSSGTVSVDGSGSKLAIADILNVGGAGVSLDGQLAAEGFGNVTASNDGLITVARTLRVSPTGVIIVAPTATGDTTGGRIYVGTDNTGPDGAIRIGHAGIFSGQGRASGSTVIAKNVIGNVILGAGGRFQPGGDPNLLNVVGNCDLSDGGAGGGETDFEIAGAGTAGTDYDQLVVSGTVTLGGTLNLTLLPGYVPKVGDTFSFIQAGAVTGQFTQIVAPGLSVDPVAGSGGLVVTVTAVTTVAAPAITSAATATAYVGSPFSYQITASNTPAGFTATGLPAGLTPNATSGLISGTPTTAGSYPVALSATNTGGTGTATLTLTVNAALPAGAPTITSATTATGQVGIAFSYQITASNAPTGFAATGMPAGLVFDAASGIISGTPLAAATSTVALSATNASGTGTGTLTLVISPAALPTVTVAATTRGAHLNGDTPAVYTFNLSKAQTTKTVVHYTLTGSGVNGTDFTYLNGKVKIKPGRTSATVEVVPEGDLGGAGSKTVKLLITPSSAFTVGTTTPVKVKIKP